MTGMLAVINDSFRERFRKCHENIVKICVSNDHTIEGLLELSFISPLHTVPIPFAVQQSSEKGFQVAEYKHSVIAIPLGIDSAHKALSVRLQLQFKKVRIPHQLM